MPAKRSIQCLLFDLDGTLADTAGDMIAAINFIRAEEGLPALPVDALRDHVSHGSTAMVQKGFGDQQTGTEFEARRARFLQAYANNLCHHTKLFDGMETVLQRIESLQLNWGVVTNKPAWLTEPLMAQMSLTGRAVCIISGDSTAERKPHPLPLFTAAEIAGVVAENCLYIGDAERDIQAGNSAGMTTLIANYGYIDDSQNPQQWHADGSIDHPLDLLKWLPPS